MRVVSSSWTFFFKYVTPLLWLGFGVSMIGAALIFGGAPAGYYAIAIVWLAAVACINYWNNFPIKKVAIDGDYLYISNYRSDVRIPLATVSDSRITGWAWSWWRWPPLRIVLTLGQTTAFGQQIMFIPGYYA